MLLLSAASSMKISNLEWPDTGRVSTDFVNGNFKSVAGAGEAPIGDKVADVANEASEGCAGYRTESVPPHSTFSQLGNFAELVSLMQGP